MPENDLRESEYVSPPEVHSPLGRLIGFFLYRKVLVLVGVAMLILGGIMFAPFDWPWRGNVVSPVAVDALPNTGENQQIVFAEWPGQSPQDIDEQLTYPLTSTLLGVKGVKNIRSNSMFGFASIYVIFEDSEDFYESRTRLLEKLDSLVEGKDYPVGAHPQLGPDATALGQVFWYTLEPEDEKGTPTGGWDLDELRTIQDFYVKYALMSSGGVAEVPSIGGYMREYQIDLDPDAMRLLGVTLKDVYTTVSRANTDIGAKTVELNNVEYFVRGIGFVKSTSQLEELVIKSIHGKKPVILKQIATVTLGPAQRRGALDKNGAEAVGGVVVSRFGANPLEVINNVKRKINRLQPNMDRKVLIDYTKTTPAEVAAWAKAAGFEAYIGDSLNQKMWLAHLEPLPHDQRPIWATISQVRIVPFYDRAGLIRETLGTLEDALCSEILVTFIVIILMVMHLRSSCLIGSMLPLVVGMTFILMKLFHVEANIIALAGIAIAVGTIVDMGIVICDNVVTHLGQAPRSMPRLQIIHNAISEVGSAVLSATMTTIIGFLPVFTMTGKAGRLFTPLAFTKTFALSASIFVALLIIPSGCWLILRRPGDGVGRIKLMRRFRRWVLNLITLAAVFWLLTVWWMPLSKREPFVKNLIFVIVLIGILVGLFKVFQIFYPRLLAWALRHKFAFLCMPAALFLLGMLGWLGFDKILGWPLQLVGVKESVAKTRPWRAISSVFPGLGREFMPDFDEGTFLWMPTLSVHGSITESLDVLQRQDAAIRAIPEVDMVVGKVGRVDSALDPAPISMIETVIQYKPEYRWDSDSQKWIRQWRENIHSPNDIWNEIVKAAYVPGATTASKGYPIQIRQVMLQTGMTANMGIKVFGPDLKTIEHAADEIGKLLETISAVRPATITVDRVIGKPYLIADTTSPQAQYNMQQYDLSPADVLNAVRIAIGGDVISTSIQGRQRYGIRLRYQRERRDTLEDMSKILIDTPSGRKVPLDEIVRFEYVQGPQLIRSENTFKVAYITFDTAQGWAEVNSAKAVDNAIKTAISKKKLNLPQNVTYELAGNFLNEAKANRTLRLIVPIALAMIFLILYMQFRSLITTGMIFTGVAVAFSGGFILLWIYGLAWFQDIYFFGQPMRELFQAHQINLSTAIWVGFLALFGISTDDGVVMGTYLEQRFRSDSPDSIETIRAATIHAGTRRVRACLMTTATTILALLPVLTSHGRGSDLMIPMALPSFGGMAIEVLTMLIVPVLYCMVKEWKFRHGRQTVISSKTS